MEQISKQSQIIDKISAAMFLPLQRSYILHVRPTSRQVKLVSANVSCACLMQPWVNVK